MQPGDLVAAENVDEPIGNHQPERLVQARGESSPSHLPQRRVQPLDVPDVSLHRADHRRAIGQEVVIAEEEKGLPGILEWRRDRVDGVGTDLTECAARGRHLGPLRWPSLNQLGEARVAGRNHPPCELAVLDRGEVEELVAIDPVGEDHARALPVEAVIDKGLRRLRALGTGQGRAVQDQAVHETVSRRRELHEPVTPEGLVTERLRVEAGAHLAVIAEPEANSLGHRHPGARKTPQSTDPSFVLFHRASAQLSSFWLPQWPCEPPSSPG